MASSSRHSSCLSILQLLPLQAVVAAYQLHLMEGPAACQLCSVYRPELLSRCRAQVLDASRQMAEVIAAVEAAGDTEGGQASEEEVQPVLDACLRPILTACQRSAEALVPDAPSRCAALTALLLCSLLQCCMLYAMRVPVPVVCCCDSTLAGLSGSLLRQPAAACAGWMRRPGWTPQRALCTC